MKPDESTSCGPLFDPEIEAVYSLEVIAEMAGVSAQTVLRYHEMGVIFRSGSSLGFDADDLRRIRRIEHLRNAHELTDSGIKLIAELLHEVEHLRSEIRQKRAN